MLVGEFAAEVGPELFGFEGEGVDGDLGFPGAQAVGQSAAGGGFVEIRERGGGGVAGKFGVVDLLLSGVPASDENPGARIGEPAEKAAVTALKVARVLAEKRREKRRRS